MATLTAKNLAKAYKGRRVVEDVSLTVNSGEIVGLLGPNGAGKTTTFYMVVGIVPRDAGNIIIDDDDISLLPLHARARRGIGYLPQEASIFRRLSVYDNLMAVIFVAVGIWGGSLVGVSWKGIDSGFFWSAMQNAVDWRMDLVNCLIKSVVFAITVTWISLFNGYDAIPTSAGISRATTRTVVHSSLAVLGLDFVLTALMFGN